MDTDLCDSFGCSPAQKPTKVIDVAVNAPIREQTEKVQASPGCFEVAAESAQCWVAGEAAISDSLADSHEFLANYTASTDG